MSLLLLPWWIIRRIVWQKKMYLRQQISRIICWRRRICRTGRSRRRFARSRRNRWRFTRSRARNRSQSPVGTSAWHWTRLQTMNFALVKLQSYSLNWLQVTEAMPPCSVTTYQFVLHFTTREPYRRRSVGSAEPLLLPTFNSTDSLGANDWQMTC